MKIFKSLLLAVSALLLASCNEQEITDGRIPQESLAYAQSLVGDYNGYFGMQNGKLSFSLQGDVAVLQFTGALANDLLGPNCMSQIGKLVRVAGKQDRLDRAIFSFSSGLCNEVEGKELVLNLSNKDGKVQVRADIFSYNHFERRCTWEPGAGGGYHEVCEFVQVPQYVSGQFIKN